MNLREYILEYVSSGRGNRGVNSAVTVDSILEMDMEGFIRVLDDLTSGSMALDERAYDIDLDRAYELISTIHRNDRRLHYAISDGGAGIPELWLFNRSLNEVYRMMFRNGKMLEWIEIYGNRSLKVKGTSSSFVNSWFMHIAEFKGNYGTNNLAHGLEKILEKLSKVYISKPLFESYSDDRKNYLLEYVSSGRGRIIKATDETIRQIVKDGLDSFGHDADLNYIDVSRVTNMDSLFSCYDGDLGPTYSDLNPDISRWNVSNVKCMKSMFWNCENFNCDISKWVVSGVTDVAFMFRGCKNFNQDLSGWDVRNAEHHYFMFSDCPIKKEFKPEFK